MTEAAAHGHSSAPGPLAARAAQWKEVAMSSSIVRGAPFVARLASAAFALCAVASCAPTAGTFEPGPATPTVEYVTHQEILTPLPVRVRMPAASNAEHVVMLVRTWGSQGWHPMELSRAGQTWSGEVSCREVSTVTGDTRYFFVALDADGNPVGGSGSPDWPHVATIVGKLSNGAQSLPGGSIPMRCHDPADCPPDFPGCPAYAMRRHACRSDRECGGEGLRCGWDGYCDAAPRDEIIPAGGESDEEELEAAVRSVKQRYRRTASSSSPRSTR